MSLHDPVAVDAPLETTVMTVEGVRCAACIAKLEGGLRHVPGVALARLNFSTRRLRVDHSSTLDLAGLTDVISRLGFEAHPFVGETDKAGERESRRLMLALAVAGFAAMNIMLLSVSIWSGADGSTRTMFHWLSALIALPTVAYSGRPFFESAWSALRRGRTNMDVPISIGVALTTLMSLYETAIGGAHAYFDGAVMLLFFLLAGRFLDSVMRGRAQDGIAALLRNLPQDALVIGPDNVSIRRPISELAPGMRVLVAAGERVAVDGVVESGESDVDRALVTGESAPERVTPGTLVLAGTINLSAPLTVRAKAVGPDTAIADIARLMESAGQSKSRYVRIADRASRLYAPAVHTLAALSFVGWLIAGAGVHEAASIAVAVLIITCPCALGLAVPIAHVVASGALMKIGVMVKDGSALERLAVVDRVLLDKTGTTTLARFAVVGGMPHDRVALGLLLALAQASRHPLSKAVADAAIEAGAQPAAVQDLVEHAGLGIEGKFDGVACRLGRADWVSGQSHPDQDLVEVAFRFGQAPLLHILLEDQLRPDAAQAFDRMQGLGLSPELVSGDSVTVVGRMAAELRVAGVARMSPADKHQRIVELEAAGHHVLMVGDGLNDGPALKAASVAMAPGTATDVGTLAADIVFLGERLMPVPLTIVVARRTMAVVRQNFVLAIAYNALAVPLAIAGLVTPLIAALAMSGSSLLVVGNALRLKRAAR